MKREREEKWVGKTAPIMAHHDSLAPFYINFFFRRRTTSCLPPLYEYVIVE